MTTRLVVLLVFGLMPLLAVGCSSPKYVHAVFFHVKEGTPEPNVKDQVDDAYRLLADVPTVKKVESGTRDENVAREVSDVNFDIGLVVYFEDKAGYDAYEVHPTHRKYVDKHKAIWDKVQVCDFIAP